VPVVVLGPVSVVVLGVVTGFGSIKIKHMY
jgi:hypothetical protein